MSKKPDGLIIRDARTGEPVTIHISQIPRELWPDTWYDNAFWQYSRTLARDEVLELFQDSKKEIPEDMAKRFAQYIYDYVHNLATAAWLFSQDRVSYLEFIKPCLDQLKALKPLAKTRKEVMNMVHVAIDYAMDPF